MQAVKVVRFHPRNLWRVGPIGSSQRTVRRLAEPGTYADGCGLYAAVTRSDTKNWMLRYTSPGRRAATNQDAKTRQAPVV